MSILLALRNYRHQARLMKIGNPARPQLGVAHPETVDPRTRAAQQAGASASPRTTPPHTIDEPLPTRTQTILSYRLPEAERVVVNGGIRPQAQSRKESGEIAVTLNISTPSEGES